MTNVLRMARASMLFVAFGLLFVACQDAVTPTEQQLSPEPIQLSIVSGNKQTAAAGSELPNPLVVRVLTADGVPVRNQIVNFRVTKGGGSVFAGAALTNSEGVAQERWTLGSALGEQNVEARAVDSGSGDKLLYATFAATAVDPSDLVASVAISPSSVNLTVDGRQQLTATARNASGEAIPNKTFTWSSSNTSVATVNSSGVVRGRAVGTATIRAAVDGKSRTVTVNVAAGGSSSDTTPPAKPSSPTIEVATVSADSFRVTASWGSVNDAARYTWTSGSDTGAFARTGQTSSTSTTFRARLLSNTAAYWFCVIAVDAAGNSSDPACANYAPPTSSRPAAVSRVTVSPTSASLTVGETQRLTARALDANGNGISDVTFTWRSSNTSVATVNSSGQVTARASGRATITVTADGKSASSEVTVATSTSGGGGGSGGSGSQGSWPNEPSGFTFLTENDFSGNNGTGNGWQFANRLGSYINGLSDSGAPGSPSRFGRAQYRAGYPGGGEPFTVFHSNAGGNRNELYMAFWFRLSDNWYGHVESGVNKLFHLWTPNGGSTVVLSAQGTGNGPLMAQVRLQGAAPAANYSPNVGSGTIRRGRWTRWEIYINLSTGVMRWWLTEAGGAPVKVGEYTNVNFGRATAFSQIEWAPTYGGMGGSVPSQQTMDMDHLYISGR